MQHSIPNGIPIIVIKNTTAVNRAWSERIQPIVTAQKMFRKQLQQPEQHRAPSSCMSSSVNTRRLPKGNSRNHEILIACKPQGIKMIVQHNTIPVKNHAKNICHPARRNQTMFSIHEHGPLRSRVKDTYRFCFVVVASASRCCGCWYCC